MSSNASVSARLAIDARALDGLRTQAKDAPEAALKQAASQFEALFVNMLLKSMRDALPKEDMLATDATRMYTGMLDEQFAQNMAGRGLGLADLMVKQLSRQPERPAHSALERPAPSTIEQIDGQTKGVELPLAAPRAFPLRPAEPRPLELLRTPVNGQGVAPADSAAPASGNPKQFLRSMNEHALEAEKASGIPAHFILGQAALESGWGRREIRAPDGSGTRNLFGIKAGRGWTGATVDVLTTEYVNGQPHKTVEKFRAYGSYAEAFRDYAGLLANNPRYAGALAESGNAASFSQRLQQAGYATDPNYAQKLTKTINQALALGRVA